MRAFITLIFTPVGTLVNCCFRLLRSIRQNAEETLVISYYTRVIQSAELMKFYKNFSKTLTVVKTDTHYLSAECIRASLT